jgi:hypothetical protein
VWLVLATSNPVTLNRQQILDADAVVTVRVLKVHEGRCRIERQWTGAALPEEIVVHELDKTPASEAGQWILPLAATADGNEIIPSQLPSHARLVYPATPEAVQQLERILGRQRATRP